MSKIKGIYAAGMSILNANKSLLDYISDLFVGIRIEEGQKMNRKQNY